MKEKEKIALIKKNEAGFQRKWLDNHYLREQYYRLKEVSWIKKQEKETLERENKTETLDRNYFMYSVEG